MHCEDEKKLHDPNKPKPVEPEVEAQGVDQDPPPPKGGHPVNGG